MAGGAPNFNVDASDLQVAVLVTGWHKKVMDGLQAGAERALKEAGNDTYEIWNVPGAFELPLAAQYAIDQGADVVIALGCVIYGETPHFEYVCRAATDGLTRVQLDTGIPIGFGLLTVNDEQQALDRAGLPDSKEDKGREAVEAAVLMASMK
jgi:6,7-dimethyl-8-ribityllumazine synthase